MIVKLAFGETTLRRNEVFGFRSSEVEWHLSRVLNIWQGCFTFFFGGGGCRGVYGKPGITHNRFILSEQTVSQHFFAYVLWSLQEAVYPKWLQIGFFATTMTLLTLFCLSRNFWPIMAWVVAPYPQLFPTSSTVWHFSVSEAQIDTEGKEKAHHQHSSRMDISCACRVLNGRLHEILPTRGAQIFQKSRSYLKILCTRKLTWSKFHSEGSTNIRCHHTKLIAWVTFSPRICALLLPTMVQTLGLQFKVTRELLQREQWNCRYMLLLLREYIVHRLSHHTQDSHYFIYILYVIEAGNVKFFKTQKHMYFTVSYLLIVYRL
jgi:hypothetical protein